MIWGTNRAYLDQHWSGQYLYINLCNVHNSIKPRKGRISNDNSKDRYLNIKYITRHIHVSVMTNKLHCVINNSKHAHVGL